MDIRYCNAASENIKVMTSHGPNVRLEEYADSAILFKLLFWVDDVFGVENTKSEIRIRIFEFFDQHQIEIPLPQRVVQSQGIS